MTTSLFHLAKEYCKWEIRQPFTDEVQNFLFNIRELKKRFGMRIQFGTAGLRAKMSGGYSCINDLIIIQTTQGLIKYANLVINGSRKKGVIICHDARHNSRRFAEIAASVFFENGWRVLWLDRFSPTPFVPFGVLEYNCSLGIVVTASHNPKLDNGFKVYWENGAQIIPPHAENIYAFIMNNLEPWKLYNFNRCKKNLFDVTEKLPNSYFRLCRKRYCWRSRKNKSSDLRVTYTAMHGVGGIWMQKAFESFFLRPFIPVMSQFEPDPEFPTVSFPNPEENGSLHESIRVANVNDTPIILANDPDADRLQVAEKNKGKWIKFTGNEIAALLSDFVWENHIRINANENKDNFIMLASTVSSKYLSVMAKKEGFLFEDTLTGFKWMGNVASQREKQGKTFLFAYEVEIGFLVGNLNYDKDGIRTACIFTELANRLYDEGKTCQKRLSELYKKYGYFEMENSYFLYSDKMKLDDLFKEILNNGKYHDKMFNYKIIRIRDVKRGYDSIEPDKVCSLPRCKSEMISFSFENGAFATIRPSGTEPKLKYYFESIDFHKKELAKKMLKMMVPLFIKQFIQPKKYKLISRNP